MDDRLRHLGSSFKNKTSKQAETNLRVNLENTTNLIKKNFNPITTTVNSNEQFDLERGTSNLFRFSGRFNVITASELNSGGLSDDDRATDVVDWNPLFIEWKDGGITRKSPMNWVFQMCYPSSLNYDYQLWGPNRPVSLGMKVTNLVVSTEKFNNRSLLVIETKQNNKLSVGDYIHLNDFKGGKYLGVHKVLMLGNTGENIPNSITVDTTWDGSINSDDMYIKRVVDFSDTDIEFKGSVVVSQFTDTDFDGGSNNSDYVLVKSNTTNTIRVNDHVEFRKEDGGELCGLHRVLNVLDDNSFIIKPENKPLSVNGYKYKLLNGVPSEYYVRYFELLTGSDYETYPTAYSSTLYPESTVKEFGVSNKTWSYHYNRDINTTILTNPRGGVLTELKMCFLKRSGSKPYNWSNVTSHWEYDSSEANTLNGLQNVSINTTGTSGSIVNLTPKNPPVVGSKYIGDISEFNRREVKEKTITEVIFRFGLQSTKDSEGYHYKPFKTVNIFKQSNIITTFDLDEPYGEVPNDVVLNPNNTISWRKVLKPGVVEEGVNGVNWPFINGRHYIYSNDVMYIRRQNPNKIIDQDGVVIVDTNSNC